MEEWRQNSQMDFYRSQGIQTEGIAEVNVYIKVYDEFINEQVIWDQQVLGIDWIVCDYMDGFED